MEEFTTQKFNFEGGPLDGCVLEVPVDRYLVDIFIGVPAKMDGDEQDLMSGESIHQYTNCHSWSVEGTGVVENYMGHVAVRNVSLEVINKVFSSRTIITPENRQWIDD